VIGVVTATALWLGAALASSAATFTEDFAADPSAHSWSRFGESELFHWNAEAGRLDVTWDSYKPNSYFHRALPFALTKSDDFAFAFDLLLNDVAIGLDEAHTDTFEIGVGLLNFATATAPEFKRGTGTDSPNLADVTWFPDGGFGATLSPSIISTNHQWATQFAFPIDLATGVLHHLELAYTAADRTLRTKLTSGGQPGPAIADVRLADDFTNFFVDTLAVCSYSHAGFNGSIRAHGSIDNLAVVTPEPPVSDLVFQFNGAIRQVKFQSQLGWSYVLESTGDFSHWGPAGVATPGTGGVMTLDDQQEALFPFHFYRVRADRQ
jgi:hypothetical protein